LLAFLPGCWNGRDEEMSHHAVAVGGVLCPDPTWSVGLVHPEEQRHLSHTFTLQNQTDKTIPIEHVKSSCGCLVAKERPSEIQAHGSVGMEVSFNLLPVPGVFHHTVQVKFGDTGGATLTLKIRGIAAPTAALYASPPSLDFGRLSDTETRTRTARVSRYDFSSIEVVRLTSDLEDCALEAQPASDGDAILLSVTLLGTRLRPGSNSGAVLVETGHARFPSCRIPIYAEVTTVTDAFVSSVLIDSIAPGSHQSFSLYRPGIATSDKPEIARLEYKGDPDLRLETSAQIENEGEALQRPQLYVSAQVKSGLVKKGVIRIGVTRRPSAEIEVPVIVFVK
jgi:hypothetical protein